jgi:hypothetical protein
VSTSTTAVPAQRGAHPAPWALVVAVAIGLLGSTLAIGLNSIAIAAVAFVLAIAAASIRVLESWPALVTGLLLVIFLIPIKRYKLPGNLPFDLEPYRLLVFGLALLWIAALLVDRRLPLRRTLFDLPLLVLMLAVLASASTHVGFIERIDVTSDVVKAVSFFASFLVVYFVLANVINERWQVERLLRWIVGLAAVVAFLGIVEYRTGFNVFNHLSKVIPVLHYQGDLELTRSGRFRVLGSAQHPIAFGAALGMVFPLAVYLALTTRRRGWWVASFLIGLGALASLSRTGVVAIFAGLMALFIARPTDIRRLIPLVVPVLVIVHLILPNALGTIKSSFFPVGGLIAEQSALEPNNQLYGNGRLADIGPTLREWRQEPFFGRGYGSRIVERGPRQNAAILDDQWLGFLLDAGLFGVLALGWTVIRAVRRLGRIARGDPSDLGFLAGAIAASIVSFAVGMLTYDAFDFIQATMLFFMLLALGATVVSLGQRAVPARR